MHCAPENVSVHFDLLSLRAPYKFQLYLLTYLAYLRRQLQYMATAKRLQLWHCTVNIPLPYANPSKYIVNYYEYWPKMATKTIQSNAKRLHPITFSEVAIFYPGEQRPPIADVQVWGVPVRPPSRLPVDYSPQSTCVASGSRVRFFPRL